MPLARFQLHNSLCEASAHRSANFRFGDRGKVALQHELVTSLERLRIGLACCSELRQYLGGIVQCRFFASIRVEKHLAEAYLIRGPVIRLLIPKVLLKFPFRRLLHHCKITGQKFQLLRHAPPGDGVILVQSHGDSLAVENIFTHVLLDNPVNLLPGRRSIPATFPLADKCINAVGIDANGGVAIVLFRRAKQRKSTVNARTDDQELHKRLGGKPG